MNAARTLTVTGTLDVEQLWPTAKGKGSDADTLKIAVNRDSFQHAGRLTHVFEQAYRLDHREPVPLLKERILTVRLQGVDAPELHYATDVPTEEARRKNGDFRQPLGKWATLELALALQTFARTKRGGTLPVTVTSTNIDEPNDAFDKFGRLVGDVALPRLLHGSPTINAWLLAKGWAFPALYDSMTVEEVQRARRLAARARALKLGVWARFSEEYALTFDPTLRFDHEIPTHEPAGYVAWPKLFRRMCVAYVRFGGVKRVDDVMSETDRFRETDEWMGDVDAPTRPLADVLRRTTQGWTMAVSPDEVMLKEAATELFDGRRAKRTKLVEW